MLSCQKEIYDTIFPGFRINHRFLRDYAYQLRQCLRNPAERLLVLDHDGAVVGFMWLSLTGTAVDSCAGYIKNIYVAPQLRGQGYARLLLAAADEWFCASGCQRSALDASICNERAVNIYHQAGYRPVRYRMEKVYPGGLEDELNTGESY